MISYIDQESVENGVTTVHAMEGSRVDGDRDFKVLMEIRENLKTRVVPFYETFDVNKVKTMGLSRIGGCGRMNLDGEANSYTAALLDSYSDSPNTSGSLTYTQEEIDDFVMKAHLAGLQIGMHAIGDAAIEQLLSAYEKALKNVPVNDHRHRIEHCYLPSENQIERAAALEIILSMQPCLTDLWGGYGGIYYSRFGQNRFQRIDRYRNLFDRGILVCGGSDSPAAGVNPLRDISLLVTNQISSKQSISVKEAIEMYTINGAKAAFEEDKKGSVEKGKYADVVILNDDPFEVPYSKIEDIKVDATIINGEIAYSKEAIQ
jgi:hypothetical protein